MFAHSVRGMEWNVLGKYGPHGKLLFFLIQKEPATEPIGETFSPFFNADIRTPPLFRPQEVCAPRLAGNCGGRKRWRLISSPRAGIRLENGLPIECNVGE